MSKYHIVLPEKGANMKYYRNFVGYFRKILEDCSIKYELDGSINEGEVVYPTATKFLMLLNDKKVVIDFSDNIIHLPTWRKFDAYFKYHYVRSIQGVCETIYPFAPVSFYDWNRYREIKKEIKYSCSSDVVLNMQRPGGNATERRNNVRDLLREKYGNLAILRPSDSQEDYWKRINDCLVHVFVPGCRNNMIDRASLQYLAFGCCTIQPPIDDELPYSGVLVPNVHYVQCKPDYSDLVDKIEWCRVSRKKCVEIGENAKKLFEECCTPDKLWKWILLNTFRKESK